jgi:steroid delta-isomerase-like uncharacterized protein
VGIRNGKHAHAWLLLSGGHVEITAYERTWIEGLNRGDISTADQVFAPECIIHINGSPEPNLSVNGFKHMLAGLLAAFPDLRFAIEDQIVAGDKVATRWTAEGTHGGALGSVPATGRRVRIGGMILDRVAAGKVVERWELWDQMGMVQQLGLA